MNQVKESLIVKLFDIGAFKTGSFKLKSGLISPIYIDLRVIISYPEVMKTIVDLLCDVIKREIGEHEIKKWKVCGVPYTALPLATLICERFGLSMVMRRKEKKEHGTAQLIEGKYEKGDRVLIIEDLVTSGTSIFETATDLQNCGMQPSRAVLFLDREQGGIRNLHDRGIEASACTTLHEFLEVLVSSRRIDEAAQRAALEFVGGTQTELPAQKLNGTTKTGKSKRSFMKRASGSKNEKSKKLFELMATKKTNVIVAADLHTGKEVLELARRIGHLICVLKLHYDVLSGLEGSFFSELKKVATEKNFMLMEDRKYADIGTIVQRQLTSSTCAGEYTVASWADFITVHAIAGSGALEAIRALPSAERPGVILIAELSAAENMIDTEYTRKTVEMALKYPDVVSGFVAQSDVLTKHPQDQTDGFVLMTPGVSLSAKGDTFGQKYRTPEVVITEGHADCVIVGRDVCNSTDPLASAERYREVSVKALLQITDSE